MPQKHPPAKTTVSVAGDPASTTFTRGARSGGPEAARAVPEADMPSAATNVDIIALRRANLRFIEIPSWLCQVSVWCSGPASRLPFSAHVTDEPFGRERDPDSGAKRREFIHRGPGGPHCLEECPGKIDVRRAVGAPLDVTNDPFAIDLGQGAVEVRPETADDGFTFCASGHASRSALARGRSEERRV